MRCASGWNPPRGSKSNALTHQCQSVGGGYHTREVETFDAPLIDQNANREMFEESVEVMFKALEGTPFSHQGKYCTIPPEVPYRGDTLKEITLVPAPERLPVECWR
jgi:alkanesulfonate monooxygenase SsuD/methylene tetrahydromethanopterin reductase-like flavin-dependent oxidoreductase (luciferase family)